MERIIIFSIVIQLFFVNCTNKKCSQHKNIAQKFITDFYYNKDNKIIKLEDIFIYTPIQKEDFDKLSEEDKKLANQYVFEYMDYLQQNLKNKNISLICYQDIDFEKYRNDINYESYKKMDFKDTENVVFVITDDEILSFFIFDKNDKIISFFLDVWGSHFEKKIIPIYLEEMLTTLLLINK